MIITSLFNVGFYGISKEKLARRDQPLHGSHSIGTFRILLLMTSLRRLEVKVLG
jgi:hypothetical protein